MSPHSRPFSQATAGLIASLWRWKSFFLVVGATLTGMDVEIVPQRGRRLDQGRARSALEAAVHRTRVSAADRAAQILCAPMATAPISCTGGGQDFVRAYAEPVYGIPVEQVRRNHVRTSVQTRA